MDLISVIIPVFNRETMIEECLNSVLNNTYNNLEVIIIDDGSTDGTLNICRKIQEADDRIKIFESAHSGVSRARNIGLDNARGEYVFFVDSDDIINPKLLEVLHDGIVENGVEISATGILNIPQAKWSIVKTYIEKTNDFTVKCFNNSEAIHQMFRKTTPINLIGGVMMAKKLIGDTRFREELFIGEDFYFVYENVIKGPSIVFTKYAMYYCRIHNNSSFNYGFDAFLSRFNRRVLVWRNEEKSGRYDNAILQKIDAFGCFTICVSEHKPYSDEAKKMRKVVLEHRKELIKGVNFKIKLIVFFSLYAPLLSQIIFKCRNKLKRIKKS